MAKDVVCGMEVDPQTATAQSSHQGEPYYFCSSGCRASFERDPERYLRAAILSEGLGYTAELAQQAGCAEASRQLTDWAERLYEPCEHRRAERTAGPSAKAGETGCESELWLG